LKRCLTIIESFVIRRAVCNIPTNSLGNIFLGLTNEIEVDGNNISNSLHDRISNFNPTRRFPNDIEFSNALKQDNLYGRPVTKYILEQLEMSHGHQEAANLQSTTIEHIMPQTLNQEWLNDLGDDADQHSLLIHTIGNLTLTAYNAELSNHSFTQKRQIYENSNIQLNSFIAQKEQWGVNEINERAEVLATLAIGLWIPPFQRP